MTAGGTIVPGGNPVTADPGLNLRSPFASVVSNGACHRARYGQPEGLSVNGGRIHRRAKSGDDYGVRTYTASAGSWCYRNHRGRPCLTDSVTCREPPYKVTRQSMAEYVHGSSRNRGGVCRV